MNHLNKKKIDTTFMKNIKKEKKIIYFFGKNFLKYIYNYIQKKSRAPKF